MDPRRDLIIPQRSVSQPSPERQMVGCYKHLGISIHFSTARYLTWQSDASSATYSNVFKGNWEE